MILGGQKNQKNAEHILSIAGLLIPLLLAIYGLILELGQLSTSRYLSDEVFFVIIFLWLAMALLQFIRPAVKGSMPLLRLTAYHLLSIAYMLLVSGLQSPLVIMWVVLMLASYIYYGAKGLKINLATFFLMVALDIFAHQPEVNSAFFAYLTPTVAAILTGLITVAIVRTQQIDQGELIRSQRQELLQRERTLTIVNNLADAVLSTDKDGIIRVYNAAALSLFDTNDSLNGRQIEGLLELRDEKNNKFVFSELFAAAKTVIVRDDITSQLANGDMMRLEVTVSPIRSSYGKDTKDHSEDGYIVILRDITKAKTLEEERDEFISVVSHELRTPIAIAEGTISNVQLMMRRPDIKQEILNTGIDTAHDQVMFLARMVNDLSTLSRAERGVYDSVEDISIKELTHTLFNNYREQAEAKGLHLNLDTHGRLGTIRVSRLYVEELLQNFLTNAIKYTHEGSVTLEVVQAESDVTFSVKDTGIGISKSDQQKVFDKFYRSEDYRTRETGGTGLGLYVAAKLARKLNTEIKLTSRLNHGSTFSFSLPVVKAAKNKKTNATS